MAVTHMAIFPQAINTTPIQFANGDGTTEKDVYAAGANGSKVEAIFAASTDTVDRDILLYVKVGATDILLGTIKIPANSGNTDALPSLNLLASSQLPLNKDAQGNAYLLLSSTAVLRAAMGGTITSGKVVNLVPQVEEF